ncbi:contractile injection system tape measure protein [Synechococcus sp. PCC 7336]|uniref:contractile injection system tape measure protein n=1 Tax=Synechococcus sp. PCC 7336 TaxID=195250 RepID=UPI00037560A8|nr:contractile injection system tape measure protein [Synechococcus sp. PCC 7336]
MPPQHHIIGRTIVDLDTGPLADVWSLQEDVNQLVQQEMLPQLEILFDRLSEPDRTLRLDRVVLDVGHVAPKSLPQDWVPRLLAQLEQVLRDRIGGYSDGGVDESPPILRERTEAHWEVLQFFLQYGRLPWWQTSGSWSATVARWQQAVAEPVSRWVEQVRQVLGTSPIARQRFAVQLPEPLQESLLLQLQPAWSDWPLLRSQIQQLLQALDWGDRSRRDLERQAVQLLLAEIVPNRPVSSLLPAVSWARAWMEQVVREGRSQWFPSASAETEPIEPLTSPDRRLHQQLLAAIADFSPVQRSLWLEAIAHSLPAIASTPTEPSETEARSAPEPRTDADSPLSPAAQPASSPEPVSGDGATPDAVQGVSPESDPVAETAGSPPRERSADSEPLPSQLTTGDRASASPLNAAPSALSPEEERAGIYIPQAGLVLLHPFLKIYFEAIDLLADSQFRDESARQTAVYLMHWLATGDPAGAEVDLVLPKLLCNWPLNDPIAPIALPAAALEEGEHLLQVAIDRWGALKSASPDGLRQGFLQRQGKLTRTSSHDWQLHVEQTSLDILLARLPWGLSMVKLPWMDCLLTVEWS